MIHREVPSLTSQIFSTHRVKSFITFDTRRVIAATRLEIVARGFLIGMPHEARWSSPEGPVRMSGKRTILAGRRR